MSLLADDRFGALAQGDHVCAVYSDPAEQAAAMVRYIRTGLEGHERCVYILDDRTGAEIRDRLNADGVDVPAALAARRLLLLTKRQSYLRDGEFSPSAMVEYLRSAEAAALADGLSGLRVTGEMTWALGPEIGCDRVMEYEAALNEFFPGSRSHAICQYNRKRFGPEVIRDVLRTHPIAILGQQVCPNPYYEPPHLARRAPDDAANARVDWMIAQLVTLRENELKLREAIAARDEFLSVASHELRTPLNALALAVQGLAALGVRAAQLDRITRAVERLNRLVDTTFDVSRLRERQRRLQPALCDLKEIVAEVAHRFELEAAHVRSPIRVDVPPVLGWWDRQALDQILSNLLSNALKYGRGEAIDVAGEVGDGYVLVTVRDRGIGIDPEHRQRVFGRFERAVSGRSYSGFGLGLWIARECATAMGGDITIAEADDGPGSVFQLALPIGDAADTRH